MILTYLISSNRSQIKIAARENAPVFPDCSSGIERIENFLKIVLRNFRKLPSKTSILEILSEIADSLIFF